VSGSSGPHKQQYKPRAERNGSAAGFTLIEVMITMSILLGLVVAVSSMLRSSIDVRQSLAREARITHRIQLAMTRLSHDIEHTFITGVNEDHRGGANRRFKTIFRIDKNSESDKILMSVAGQDPLRKDAHEGDTGYVVYEVKEAKDAPGRKHLYRGYAPLVLDDLKADPPMKLLVRNIKSMKVTAWRGDDWSNDRWDSSRGEWRDKLPQMVKVEIETWSEDDNEVNSDSTGKEIDNAATVSIKTIVRLQNARLMKELKQPNKSARIY
jgi:prepilin-type N-terminal cleavage/methylation domain-containing protein